MKYLDILWDDMGATVMFGKTTTHSEYIEGTESEVRAVISKNYDLSQYTVSEAHVDDFDMPEYDYEDSY